MLLDRVYVSAMQHLMAARESTLGTPNHQGPNRKFDAAIHQLWVSPIYMKVVALDVAAVVAESLARRFASSIIVMMTMVFLKGAPPESSA
jgi:hypothetical protein